MIVETIHASNRRGYTNCGDATPGRGQANVERYPERWQHVNCILCLETRWMSEGATQR